MVLYSWCLMLVAFRGTLATDYPSVVEYDLVFPRNNGIYSPSPIFPIVFAIQSPRALNFFQSSPGVTLGAGTEGMIYSDGLDFDHNFTFTSNPYYFSFATQDVPDAHGNYSLHWYWRTYDCRNKSGPTNATYILSENRIFFTFQQNHTKVLDF